MDILVIGDIMLDINYYGNSKRLAQEATIPIVLLDNIKNDLGGAGYVAYNLSLLGLQVGLCGVIGNDDNSKKIIETLNANNINYDGVFIEEDRVTTTKNRIYSNNNLISRFDCEVIKNISDTTKQKIIRYIKNTINNTNFVIISDYMKGVLACDLCSEIINICNTNNKKLFIDSKDKNYSKYTNCFLFKPNRKEAENILNQNINKDNFELCVKKIKNIINCNVCILTLDKDGLCYIDENNNYEYIEQKITNATNIIGAGDILLASFVFMYFISQNIKKSIEFSHYCVQKKISNLNQYKISLNDIIFYYKNVNKVINKKDLEYIKLWCERENKKIVFTNGCFDILHYGHIYYLNKAKQLGDLLIIGLNTDNSVKSNKGDERPYNNELYRTEQLKSLECVDFIILFNDKTPIEIVKDLNPDFYVKGGDYKLEQLEERKYSKNTVIFDYINNLSTTRFLAITR